MEIKISKKELRLVEHHEFTIKINNKELLMAIQYDINDSKIINLKAHEIHTWDTLTDDEKMEVHKTIYKYFNQEIIEMKIVDIKQMPNYNTAVTNGVDSVTAGKVFVKNDPPYSYPCCIRHGAMLKVSKDGIWRCGELGCDNGCYEIR